MGVEDAAGGKNLALASICFPEVRAVGGGGGAFQGDGLLGVRLAKDDYLYGETAFGLPDVGAAVRVRNCRSLFPGVSVWELCVFVWACG
jgi:hypothetical protein